MALISNFHRLMGNPQRHLFSPSYNEMLNQGAMLHCRKSQAAAFSVYAAQPRGYYPPYCWIWPYKVRDLASRNLTSFAISATGSGANGLGFPATASFSITTSALGSLIAGAVGSSSFSITSSGGVVATIGSPGSASFTISGTAAIEALGWASGGADIQFLATLTAWALGWMEGTTDVSAEVTPESVAAAVWRAVAGDFQESGSMGEKLNDAGSAANPWTEIIESGYTAEEILRLVAAALLGKVSGADVNNPKFRNLGDTKDRIDATTDQHGNRLVVALDAD
jgi:hypothetical protein